MDPQLCLENRWSKGGLTAVGCCSRQSREELLSADWSWLLDGVSLTRLVLMQKLLFVCEILENLH
jgi:hypothetical protein